jgi:hypothetical protein
MVTAKAGLIHATACALISNFSAFSSSAFSLWTLLGTAYSQSKAGEGTRAVICLSSVLQLRKLRWREDFL